MIDIFKYSIYFQLLVGLLPIAFANWNRCFIPLNINLVISVYSTLLIIISKIFSYQNIFIFYSFILSSFICYTFFFIAKVSNLFKFLILLKFIIFTTIYFLTINKNGHSQLILMTYHISLILFPIYYFLTKIYSDKVDVYSSTMNIISLSVLIYSTSTVLLFYVIELFMANRLWFIHNLIEGISKLIIAYAFWKIPQQSPSQK